MSPRSPRLKDIVIPGSSRSVSVKWTSHTNLDAAQSVRIAESQAMWGTVNTFMDLARTAGQVYLASQGWPAPKPTSAPAPR